MYQGEQISGALVAGQMGKLNPVQLLDPGPQVAFPSVRFDLFAASHTDRPPDCV